MVTTVSDVCNVSNVQLYVLIKKKLKNKKSNNNNNLIEKNIH